ncbi:hypothetical protein [Shouchella shacheensis]|uniref:hypothetical protein n=1 Tax=Shouchella shacheensis TaxID=1649580 RepID=UPI000B0E8EBC|nr:hypothetical protein [Shouchella shacheensis]
MDILIPIGIGALGSLLLYFLLRVFKVPNPGLFTLIAPVIAFVISLIVGSWIGMGVGVICMGMFVASICLIFIDAAKERSRSRNMTN